MFCYRARQAITAAGDGGCNAKDGNPFGSFWDTFSIDFDSSEYYSPLEYDTLRPGVAREWNDRFVTPWIVAVIVNVIFILPAFPENTDSAAQQNKFLSFSIYVCQEQTQGLSDNQFNPSFGKKKQDSPEQDTILQPWSRRTTTEPWGIARQWDEWFVTPRWALGSKG